jgi:hypothetical protein
MPWSIAKQKARDYEDGTRDRKQLTALFDACFRIQREASEAAGRRIPLVIENVRGAQRWVGRARWNFGSFYLWGDVPALMPITLRHVKVPTMGAGWYPPGHPKHVAGLAFNTHAERAVGRRTDVGNGARFTSRDCGIEGTKQAGISGPRNNGKGDARFQDGAARHGSKSLARKAASAMIAKIPLVLSRHIAAAWKPGDERAVSTRVERTGS